MIVTGARPQRGEVRKAADLPPDEPVFAYDIKIDDFRSAPASKFAALGMNAYWNGERWNVYLKRVGSER